jgi:hypothetical protein
LYYSSYIRVIKSNITCPGHVACTSIREMRNAFQSENQINRLRKRDNNMRVDLKYIWWETVAWIQRDQNWISGGLLWIL